MGQAQTALRSLVRCVSGGGKPRWEIYLDLQCPYSRTMYNKLPDLKAAFGEEFEMIVRYTALPFHFSAYPALQMIHVPEVDRDAFAKKCFEEQERFYNAKTATLNREQIYEILAELAIESGCTLQKKELVEKAQDWKLATLPAWVEMKEAIRDRVMGTPISAIDDVVVEGTESAWGVEEWRAKLATL